MEYNYSLKSENSVSSKIYVFLAANYDISNLASKIYAENNFKKGILNLKKIGNIQDVAAI